MGKEEGGTGVDRLAPFLSPEFELVAAATSLGSSGS